MSTKYQVTDSRGVVHKRTTAERVYTHCVVCHRKAIPAGNGWLDRPARDYVSWAGRLDLAQKIARGWTGEYADGVEIIPAVEVGK